MISYPFKKERTLFMNIRWNIILGVIALALLGWYYSLNQDHGDLQSLIKKPDSPEYVGNKMETTVFSPEGKKQYRPRTVQADAICGGRGPKRKERVVRQYEPCLS